jgi:soluble lytic murein transglycosylase-like protein
LPGLSELAKAVAWQESRGRQMDANGNTLTSSAGALGIMQLMPATARGLGVDPNNEADNLRGGTMLLSQLLKHYSGNQAKSLAAYNWGEGNLDRSIKAHKGFYLDNLPSETQNYVRSIEARMGNQVANNGDITVNVYAKTDASPQQIAALVKDTLNDQNAKQSRFDRAGSVGSAQ